MFRSSLPGRRDNLWTASILKECSPSVKRAWRFLAIRQTLREQNADCAESAGLALRISSRP